MKLITLFALTLPVIINIVSYGITELEIHNNYNVKVQYAVDSSPQEAIQQFNEVKNWMERKDLTTGNTCVFIKSNPNCELKNYYENRILQSIKESSEVNKNDTTAVSNLSLKLNERFIAKDNKGSEYIKSPQNFNLYLRWKNLLLFGYLINIYCYLYLIAIWFIAYFMLNN